MSDPFFRNYKALKITGIVIVALFVLGVVVELAAPDKGAKTTTSTNDDAGTPRDIADDQRCAAHDTPVHDTPVHDVHHHAAYHGRVTGDHRGALQVHRGPNYRQ